MCSLTLIKTLTSSIVLYPWPRLSGWLCTFLRTSLQFPLGSRNTGLLIPVKGKSCSAQWIVINYSPGYSHLRWDGFLWFHWRLFSSFLLSLADKIWGRGKCSFENRKSILFDLKESCLGIRRQGRCSHLTVWERLGLWGNIVKSGGPGRRVIRVLVSALTLTGCVTGNKSFNLSAPGFWSIK